MKRISTFLEIMLSVILVAVGLYLLEEGTSSKSVNATAMLIGGAVCFTLSAMVLVSAVKSVLWHRRMLRHSIQNQNFDSAASEHNRS